MRETEIRDGVEKYQLGVTGHWVEAHPVPDLHRGLKFYSTMCPSPCFIIEGNDPKELERHPTHIPGGIPDREEQGEYWLLYFPSSGSEPIQWLPGEYIREQFQGGQYKLEPVEMAKDRGMDSEAWWQPIIEEDMEDEEDQPYDFIEINNSEEINSNKDRLEISAENYAELRNRDAVFSIDSSSNTPDLDLEKYNYVSNHDKGGEEDNGLLQYISTVVKQLV